MLIILEGPDGAGKTTLAAQLAQLIANHNPGVRAYIQHARAPVNHPLDEYLRTVTHYRPGSAQHLILDRFHWGESVYPIVFKRATQLDFSARWSIEAYLQRLGALVVLVNQFDADYVRTYEERGESQFIDLLPRTRQLFSRVAAESRLPFVEYNWRTSEINGLQGIVDVARGVEANYKSLKQFTTYCGPRWPNYLLLGDVRHNFGKTDVNFVEYDPSFVPFRTTSGHYLFSSLEKSPIGFWHSVGWANACDVDDPVALWKTLGAPQVVALGRNAQRCLTRHGIHHGAVRHPQFMRRFHNVKKSEYGDVIQRAATTGEDLSWWPESSKVKPDKVRTTTSSQR